MERQDPAEQGAEQPQLIGWAPELPEASGREGDEVVDLAFPGLVAALGPANDDTICASFAGAGLRLVSGGMDERACVWDPFEAQALALEKVHTDTIVALAMGRQLGPLDAATTAAELEAGSGEPEGEWGGGAAVSGDGAASPGHPGSQGAPDPVEGLLCRQPALVYTAGMDGQVCALNTYSYTLEASASAGSPLEWIAVHGAADYVLAGTSDGVAYLYDFSAAAKEASKRAAAAVRASVGQGGSAGLGAPSGLDALGMQAVAPPPSAAPSAPSAVSQPREAVMTAAYCGHGGVVSAGTFTYTRKYVVTGCADGAVRLFRALSGECLSRVELHSEVSCMALVPPDQQDRKKRNGTILAGLESGELVALTLAGDKLLQAGRFQPHQKRVEKILVCQRRYVALGSLDGNVSILDAKSGYGVRSVASLGDPVTALCYANWGSEARGGDADAPGPTARGAFGEVVSRPVLLAGTSSGYVYAIGLLDGRVMYGFNVFAPNARFGRPQDRPVLDIAWARPRGHPAVGRCGYMAVAGDANVYVWSCDPAAYVDSLNTVGAGGANAPGATGAAGIAGASGAVGAPGLAGAQLQAAADEDSKDGADGIDGGELDY